MPPRRKPLPSTRKIAVTGSIYDKWRKKAKHAAPGDEAHVPPSPSPLPAQAARGKSVALDVSAGVKPLAAIHAYENSRPSKDWNTCGQAAIGTMLDFFGLNPYGLECEPQGDSGCHWNNGDIIDALISDGCGPDNPFGLGTSVTGVARALQKHGLDATPSYSGFLLSGWEQLWEQLQSYVAAGIPVPVIIDLGVIGGPQFTIHWAIAYRIEARKVFLGNCGYKPVVPEDQFLRAWACGFLPYRFNHCGVYVRA